MPNSGLSSPQALTVRPLDKGIVLNKAAQALPAGSFTRLVNMEAKNIGIQRRGGFLERKIYSIIHPISEAANNGFSDSYRAMFNAFQSTDQTQTFLVGDNFLYKLTEKTVNSTNNLVMTRYADRRPSWSMVPQAGWQSCIIEKLATDSYMVWIPQALFSNPTVTPAENDLLEIRPLNAALAWSQNGNAAVIGIDGQGWSDGIAWSQIKPNAPYPYSMWCRVENNPIINTKTIDSVACYGFQITDRSADRLLGSWNYAAKSGFTNLVYVCDAAHETTFYTDDLHPVQWTEALRVNTVTPAPAAYFTARSWMSIRKFNPTDLAPTEVNIMAGATAISQINCIQYHRGYLYIGNFAEGNVIKKNTIRWSSPVNCESFASSDYLSFGTNSELVSLVSFGQYLVAFFGDAVFMGYPSNVAGIPFRFERIETGGIGLVNPRAWSIWADSLFFVGQNNIYRIGADASLSSIGDQIAPQIFYGADTQKKTAGMKLLCDVNSDRLVFAVPSESPLSFVQFYSFNWKSGAWSQHLLQSWIDGVDWSNPQMVGGSSTGLAYASLTGSRTYDDFDQTANELPDGDENRIDMQQGTIDSFNNRVDAARFWLLSGTKLFYYSHESPYCEYSAHFPVFFETPDLDFELAEQNKTVVEFGLKISLGQTDNIINADSHWSSPNPLVFRVYVSRDRGGSWRPYGRLRIPAGKDEGKVNQLFLGSLIRFRVVCENKFNATIQDGVDENGDPIIRTNVVETPFTVLEYHGRIRAAGREISF